MTCVPQRTLFLFVSTQPIEMDAAAEIDPAIASRAETTVQRLAPRRDEGLVALSLTCGNPFMAAAALNEPSSAESVLRLGLAVFDIENLRSASIFANGPPFTACEVAVSLDSDAFLLWARCKLGPFTDLGLVKLVNYALDSKSWKAAIALVEDERNHDAIRGPNFFNRLHQGYLAGPNALQFLDVLRPVILGRTGFPTNDDLLFSKVPNRYYVPRVLVCRDAAVRTKLANEFGLGPNFDNQERFFKISFNPPYEGKFLRMLNVFKGQKEDRIALVERYITSIEEQFKSGTHFRILFSKGLYKPRVSLLSSLFRFEWSLTSGLHQQFYDAKGKRFDMYDALRFALEHFRQFVDASHLIQAIAVTSGERSEAKPMAGLRGLVRALIYFGADPQDYAVKQKVLSSVYRGFANDIYEVKCWKRWGELQCFGNLPPEVLEQVMLCSWEQFC